MSGPAVIVNAKTSLEEIMKSLQEHKIVRVPATDDGNSSASLRDEGCHRRSAIASTVGDLQRSGFRLPVDRDAGSV